MSTRIRSHAAREMEILSKSMTDPENRPLIEPFKDEILALAEKFGKSGQSGGSAPFTATAIADAIKKLLLFDPICPLTGIDDEWVKVANITGGKLYQNARKSDVFREGTDNASAYYFDAIVWKNDKGHGFTGSAKVKVGSELKTVMSRQLIKSFPFTPKTFYIDVNEVEEAKDDWTFYVKNPKQLEKVFKYYNELPPKTP